MEEIFQTIDPTHLSLRHWEQQFPTLRVGCTTRKNDFSFQSDDPKDVERIFQLFTDTLRLPASYGFIGEQIHASNIQFVTAANIDPEVKGQSMSQMDGLITMEKNIFLLAYFADCVPLYFYDPKKEIIGIAHAGWRGTVQKIAQQMVLKFLSLGSTLDSLRVAMGPSISQTHYEVGKDLIDQIEASLRKKVAQQLSHDKYLFDLKKLNKEILLQCGVFRHNIEVTNHCTYADHELFYSYRREQESAGRMLGFIGQM